MARGKSIGISSYMIASSSSLSLPCHKVTFSRVVLNPSFGTLLNYHKFTFFLHFSIKSPHTIAIGRLTSMKPCVERLYLKVLKLSPYEV